MFRNNISYIKNANKYRKALIAVIHSPKMFHVFQGTGIDILDVYVTKDGKFAKVLFATPFQDRRESLARKLEVNAGKLKSYVSSILKSKNTPRLTFVDAEKRKMEYARETAAFEEIRRERIERGEEEEEECGFCKYMKGGSCKEAFIAWEACVDAAKARDEDFVEACFETTSALRDCMLLDPEYYRPMVGDEEKAAKEGGEATEVAEAKTA